jgi:hypothetical protein
VRSVAVVMRVIERPICGSSDDDRPENRAARRVLVIA